jgi:hypothetical protein
VAALLDHTYAQYRSEPAPPGPRPSWLPVLGVVHRIDDYSRTLRSRYPPAAPPPWPRLAHHLRDAATDVAAAYREAAVAVATGARPRARPAVRLDPVPRHELAAAPDDALRMLDTWGWLATLADDLIAVDRALAPPPAGGGPAPGTRPLPARSSTAASPR